MIKFNFVHFLHIYSSIIALTRKDGVTLKRLKPIDDSEDEQTGITLIYINQRKFFTWKCILSFHISKVFFFISVLFTLKLS